MDLQPYLHLAGQNLLNCLNPEANYLPYWHMTVDPENRAEYCFRKHCTGHNIGRWWNAMLRLEANIGFKIPGAIECAMLENSWRLADNPSGIFLEDIDLNDAATWYIHSYRETMLAYGLLVQYRGDQRAEQGGLLAIAQMSRACQDLDRWDFSYGRDVPQLVKTPTRPAYTHGRAIEGLLCFYEATGFSAALEEAERLAEYHMAHTVGPDGSLAAGCGDHTHSYLNTLRGLVLLASQQNRQNWLEALYRTYKNTLRAMITRSGFVTHDIGARFSGDIASTGDIAQIAILLWDQFEDPSLLDDVERLMRARLVPAQVSTPPPLVPLRNETTDAFHELPHRFVGAIGGNVGHVQGKTCVTDWTASALHNVIELWKRGVDENATQVRVNLHLDYDNAAVRVRSMRTGTAAHVTVQSKAAQKDLLIRIPGWVPTDSLQVTANSKSVDVALKNGFITIAATGSQQDVAVHYALPEFSDTEVWQDKSATGEVVTFNWRGDEIVGATPGGPYMAT
ncbi:MAG: hypothetical protein HOH43_13790 [Candidatus Latescibacteria bacterium]|nr:hypothetical protein [Candidatus Latescibacterota bacterium]